MGDEVDKFVTVNIKKGMMTCHGEGPLGWVKEKVKIKYTGKEIEIKVQPAMLIQILQHLRKMVVGDRLLFKGDDFNHVIALTK